MMRSAFAAVVFVVIAVASIGMIAHRYHVTYGRMAVEGRVAACEIRFFKHDLETAIEIHPVYPDARRKLDELAGLDAE